MVFAGQTDDPFWVDLGSIFDLLTLRPQAAPVGYESGPSEGVDGLAGFNVHSIAIQVPIARLLAGAGENTVLGRMGIQQPPHCACLWRWQHSKCRRPGADFTPGDAAGQ